MRNSMPVALLIALMTLLAETPINDSYSSCLPFFPSIRIPTYLLFRHQ